MTHKYLRKKFKEYETIFILSPQINQASADVVTKKITSLLENYEGKLKKVSLWGIRRLAYKIKHNTKGIYYQINYIAPQGFVEEMEKYFQTNDSIIRYLTVKVSDNTVDPLSVIVKTSDIEFGSVEGLSEAPEAEAGFAGGMLEEEIEEEEFLDTQVENDYTDEGEKTSDEEMEKGENEENENSEENKDNK